MNGPPSNLSLEPIRQESGLWRVSGETNGYLIVREGESLLIDCPLGDARQLLVEAGLPAPSVVVHTHVQAEHCGEWSSFPEAQVIVADGSEDLAAISERYLAECESIWGLERYWDDRGAETYGIAGCTTARPPVQPLSVSGTITPGAGFRWKDVEFEVIVLPGSDKRAIGLYSRSEGVLFSGDLLLAGGWLVNLYDIERCYGIPNGYKDLRESLATVRALAPRILCPATGQIITSPEEDIAKCLARTDWVFAHPVRRAERAGAMINYTSARTIGNYRQVLPGLFQQTNYGNVILYVDPNGDGILVDPGPCYWLPTTEEDHAAMHADLDMFEREAGLRRVTDVLVTHYHGDHIECADVIRERYGARLMATLDVATVLERPNDFPYPCLTPWYGFGFDILRVDGVLDYDKTIQLGMTSVTPIHLPGHCFAHTGFVIPWMGETTICTGDVIQYGDGPISFGTPIIYNDAGGPGRSASATCRTLAKWRPTVLVGGHSHSCMDPDGSIVADFLAVAEETDAKVAGMVAPGEWDAAITPRGYDSARTRLVSR